MTLRTTSRYYRVDRRELAFLKFIIEAYDGLAVVKTLEPERGIIELNIAPGCEPDMEALLADLKKSIRIMELNDGTLEQARINPMRLSAN